jgi:hypothetical protein
MDLKHEREKLIDEYEKEILPSVIDRSQQIKVNCQAIVDIGKEISEDMEDLTDTTKIKLKALNDYREIILVSDEVGWTSFVTGLKKDRSLTESLDQLNSEIIDQIAYPLGMIAASGSSMTDVSGNVCDAIFTIVASEQQVPVENIFEQYHKDSSLDVSDAFTVDD